MKAAKNAILLFMMITMLFGFISCTVNIGSSIVAPEHENVDGNSTSVDFKLSPKG